MAARNWKIRLTKQPLDPPRWAGAPAGDDETGAEGRNGHKGAGIDAGAGRVTAETRIAAKPTQVATAAQDFRDALEMTAVQGYERAQCQFPGPVSNE